MTEQSREIWGIDAEWGYSNQRIGEESAFVPVVLCAVGRVSGQRHSFWGPTEALHRFFVDHSTDIFVSHYSIAEMKYLLRLGVAMPQHWFDTFIAWRHRTNRPGTYQAGLSSALRAIGTDYTTPAKKRDLQKQIASLAFDFRSVADRQQITEYCFSDCIGALSLYQRLRDGVAPAMMNVWVEYLKAVARMELRGIPIDPDAFSRLTRNRPAIRDELINRVNEAYPVFVDGSLSRAALFSWASQNRVAWPVARSPNTGKLYRSIDNETLKSLEGRFPFLGQVRQTNKTLKQLSNRTLVLDKETGRHHFSTSVFSSLTGRNQPQKFIFSCPKWMRFLIVPESDEHVLVYVDYVAQEIGIAAALSHDVSLAAVYATPDCHVAFAVRAGAAPLGATKQTHLQIRNQYKTVNLGVLFGQTAAGVSLKLGISIGAAQRLLDDHRRLFPDFWRWSDVVVQDAYDKQCIATPCGWRSHVPFKSNERTWRNFLIQSTGADIMRLTVVYLDQQCVQLLAPVHDGFLLTCRRDQLADLRLAVDYACTKAVSQVLPGFALKWEVTVHDSGRYEDDDATAKSLWQIVRQKVWEPQ